MKKQKIYTIFFIIGVILIIINIVGLTHTLRSDDIKLPLDKDEFNKEVENIFNSSISVEKKVEKVNNLVYNNIFYYGDKGDFKYLEDYNLIIPVYENYILYFFQFIYPSRFKPYEFKNSEKAIERGVGICSQYAIVISEILRDNGIDSKVIALTGHVVASANIDKEKNIWWVVDPTYNVIIKHDINEIEKNPDIVYPYYHVNGYTNKNELNNIVKNYGVSGNRVYHSGVSGYWGIYYYVELISYWAIWIIPLLLMYPLVHSKLKRKNEFAIVK